MKYTYVITNKDREEKVAKMIEFGSYFVVFIDII